MSETATLRRVLRKLGEAAECALPEVLSINIEPTDYKHVVTIHVHVSYDADPDQEREAAGTWWRWWNFWGTTDWTAETEGEHRYLRGDWRGWQIVLVWLGEVPAADILTDAAVPA